MDNFKFNAYTEIFFGKGQIKQLPSVLARHGKNVLLVYGGGSIKRSGLYDTIQELLRDFQIFELPGVEPNPKIETVRKGVSRTYKGYDGYAPIHHWLTRSTSYPPKPHVLTSFDFHRFFQNRWTG